MGWNIGFRAGPVGYNKRIGGSNGGGGRPLSREEQERFDRQPSMQVAKGIEALAGTVGVVVLLLAIALGGAPAFLAVVFLVGSLVFCGYFFHAINTAEREKRGGTKVAPSPNNSTYLVSEDQSLPLPRADSVCWQCDGNGFTQSALGPGWTPGKPGQPCSCDAGRAYAQKWAS
jgi:hypothetical protein